VPSLAKRKAGKRLGTKGLATKRSRYGESPVGLIKCPTLAAKETGREDEGFIKRRTEA